MCKGKKIQNSHQGCFLYQHQNYPDHLYPRMPPHPHPNMPPHNYTRIQPHPICMRPYFNYSPIYLPNGVAHHPHIPSLGYLNRTQPNIIRSYMSPNLVPPYFWPSSSKRMSEHMRNRRIQR